MENVRNDVITLKAKQEAMEIYLPKLLERFEHMEEGIRSDLRSSRSERRALVVGVYAIAVTLAGIIFAIIAGIAATVST